jgi:SAM-dependent methyltransferase
MVTSEPQDIQAEFYDGYDDGLPGDVAFYLDYARSSGEQVLELGCGTGRILCELAKAGIVVTGLDYSAEMLRRASLKLSVLDEQVRRRVNLVKDDMRSFSLDARFGAILIPHRGFAHMISADDQERALRCIHGHLSERGLLVFDLPDARPVTDTFNNSLFFFRDFVHPETHNTVVVWHCSQQDYVRQLVVHRFVYEELDGAGRSVRRTICPLTLRQTNRFEMEYMLARCGFEIEALYASYDRRPFVPGWQQVWVARRV